MPHTLQSSLKRKKIKDRALYMVLFQALQTKICKAKIKEKKVEERVKTNTYTITKTCVHAIMHVKCFDTALVSHTHTAHTSVQWPLSVNTFREQNHAKRSNCL